MTYYLRGREYPLASRDEALEQLLSLRQSDLWRSTDRNGTEIGRNT
ncbi:hypothetical protein [Telluribacter sp.]|nr:hypothetical protein [Telluribacter sp.]